MLMRLVFVIAFVLLWPSAFTHAQPTTQPDVDPFANFTRAWRNDAKWANGSVEEAEYQSGEKGGDQASITTSKVMADPATKNRAADPTAKELREAFQQASFHLAKPEHLSFSYQTLVFVGVSDLKSLRVDMSAGLTFKQFINHKGTLEWHQFSAEPGDSHQTGKYSPPKRLLYENAVPLVLRGYPFDGDHMPIEVALLPSIASAGMSSAEPVPARITYVGREEIETPMGKLATHHLAITPVGGDAASVRNFWFAADEKLLHVLVRGEKKSGVTYQLTGVKWRPK